MNKDNYKTEQRHIILECFEKNKNRQLSASDIAKNEEVAKSGIGLATIYRSLEFLESQNKIKRFSDENGRKSFWQWTNGNEKCDSHYHLKCEKCGKIVHLDCGLVHELDEHMLSEHQFRMDRSKTVFYGLCENCADDGDCEKSPEQEGKFENLDGNEKNGWEK